MASSLFKNIYITTEGNKEELVTTLDTGFTFSHTFGWQLIYTFHIQSPSVQGKSVDKYHMDDSHEITFLGCIIF